MDDENPNEELCDSLSEINEMLYDIAQQDPSRAECWTNIQRFISRRHDELSGMIEFRSDQDSFFVELRRER